jgi:hypothetical protein
MSNNKRNVTTVNATVSAAPQPQGARVVGATITPTPLTPQQQ